MSCDDLNNASPSEEQSIIEDALSIATDFLAAHAKPLSAAQEDEPSGTLPEVLNGTIDVHTNSAVVAACPNAEHNNDFILRPEQLRLLDVFRQTLRSCKTDADKFQACAYWRDKLLAENAALRYFVTEIETIMFEECKNTRKGSFRAGPKR